jgi:peptide deformylase
MRLKGGMGLAAVQVGRPICILVFDIGTEFGMLINPKLVANSGETDKQLEGCLSVVGERIAVDRDKQILVQYYNMDGTLVERQFTGLAARVVLHEMDHFEGKLIIDYED